MKSSASSHLVRGENFAILRVNCRGCGEPIALADARGALRPLPIYRDLLIEMDDGSKHSTPLCATCCARADLDLADLFRLDVEEWLLEGGKHDTRKPVKILR